MPQTIILEAWESLPSKCREWITKIAVTLVIVAVWHFRLRQPATTAVETTNTGTGNHKGVSRLLLDPLPQDLVLDENIEGEEAEEEVKESQPTVYPADTALEDEADEPSNHEDTVDVPNNNNDTMDQQKSKPTRALTLGEREAANTHVLHTPAQRDASSPRPVFRNQSRDHPGLDAFWYWCDVECSLFRIYSLGRKDGTAVHPPYIPRSRAGQVQVSLRCTNRTRRTIHVYWINYKGADVVKGKIFPGASWTQQTWIEHPWVFRDSITDDTLLYYIPDRIIPTCQQQPTIDANDPEMGVHRFDFISAPPESPYWIQIDDPVLPFPAKDHFRSPDHAADWALLHMHRMNYAHWDVLAKYLTNILHEPGNPKYRQIRIENRTFNSTVWQTPARGLLFAIGFVEQGIHIELGTTRRLTKEQVKQLSSLMFSISTWRRQNELPYEQPVGADGYGRAGFGRAGAMS
eukprot:scaffold3043_cov180-Amphora_coffeaeformis.AAC.22